MQRDSWLFMASGACCQHRDCCTQDSTGTGKMPNVQLQLQVTSVPAARPQQGEGKVKAWAEGAQQAQTSPAPQPSPAGREGSELLLWDCCCCCCQPPAAGQLCPPRCIDMLIMCFANSLDEICVKCQYLLCNFLRYLNTRP